MDDSADLAKDLFITQSSFHSNTNAEEGQDSGNFFLDDNYDPAAPEVVHYLDLSDANDWTYTVMTESQSQEMKKRKEGENAVQKPPVSLEFLPDSVDENKVCFLQVTPLIPHHDIVHCVVAHLSHIDSLLFAQIIDADLLQMLDTVDKHYEVNAKRFGGCVDDSSIKANKQKK